MKSDVFISYSIVDVQAAEAIYRVLEDVENNVLDCTKGVSYI